MKRIARITPSFVKYVPDELEDGVVYVSVEYTTAVHSCCCGCGNKVVTPLSPAQWTLAFDGETLSLSPSIGNGALPCNSHYYITRNMVRWAAPLTKEQTAVAFRRDRAAIERLHNQAPLRLASSPPEKARSSHRWRSAGKRITAAVTSVFRRRG
jgi:Family of unknown function (DUF6527)